MPQQQVWLEGYTLMGATAPLFTFVEQIFWWQSVESHSTHGSGTTSELYVWPPTRRRAGRTRRLGGTSRRSWRCARCPPCSLPGRSSPLCSEPCMPPARYGRLALPWRWCTWAAAPCICSSGRARLWRPWRRLPRCCAARSLACRRYVACPFGALIAQNVCGIVRKCGGGNWLFAPTLAGSWPRCNTRVCSHFSARKSTHVTAGAFTQRLPQGNMGCLFGVRNPDMRAGGRPHLLAGLGLRSPGWTTVGSVLGLRECCKQAKGCRRPRVASRMPISLGMCTDEKLIITRPLMTY